MTPKPGFRKPKNRQTKLHLVFDENARREYLTGFRKRKAERRRKFNEKLKLELKQERKRLQTELQEKIRKSASHRGVPEVQHLIDEEPDTIEFEDHTVTISNITDSQFQQENLFLGTNTGSNSVSSEDAKTLLDKKKQEKLLNRKIQTKLQKTKAFRIQNQIQKNKNKKRMKKNPKSKKS